MADRAGADAGADRPGSDAGADAGQSSYFDCTDFSNRRVRVENELLQYPAPARPNFGDCGSLGAIKDIVMNCLFVCQCLQLCSLIQIRSYSNEMIE